MCFNQYLKRKGLQNSWTYAKITSETCFSKTKISGPVTFSLELVSSPRNWTANNSCSPVISTHFFYFTGHLPVYLLVNISLIVCESMLLKIITFEISNWRFYTAKNLRNIVRSILLKTAFEIPWFLIKEANQQTYLHKTIASMAYVFPTWTTNEAFMKKHMMWLNLLLVLFFLFLAYFLKNLHLAIFLASSKAG